MSGRPDTKMLRAFFSKVDWVDENGCWIWGSAMSDKGRAAFRGTTAARWAYTWFVAEIPDGFQVDHLCCNKACVNPAHMQAVTGSENVRRVFVRSGANLVCKRGHAKTPETYRRTGNTYACLICVRAARKLSRLVISSGLSEIVVELKR